MRLRIPALLKQHDLTAYEMAKRSGGRISIRQAYRLANGEVTQVPLVVLDALCDVFGIMDPGPLLEHDQPKPSKRRR